MEKKIEYATKIMAKITEMFSEGDENYINEAEFDKDDNTTDFFHALANIVPTTMYNNMTGCDLTLLDFNHVANRLVFQNSKLGEKTKVNGGWGEKDSDMLKDTLNK